MYKNWEVTWSGELPGTPQQIFDGFTRDNASYMWPVSYEPRVGGAEPHQDGAQERPRPEIERPVRLPLGQTPHERQALPRRQTREVDQGEVPASRRRHDLDRMAVAVRESGAQRLVAPDDRSQAPLERGQVQGAVQPQGAGDIVGWAAGHQLVEHP